MIRTATTSAEAYRAIVEHVSRIGDTEMGRARFLAVAAAAFALATPALADPCKAIPDRGPMPSYLKRGMTFSGPVPYVGDGDSLCVDVSPDPVWLKTKDATAPTPEMARQWVEVRLADFYAPELHSEGGRDAAMMLAIVTAGHVLTCTASHRSHDRVVATCRINGVSVGDLMRGAGVVEGGNGR